MIDDTLLEEFKEEMKKVLDEKFDKYQETWKYCTLVHLKKKFDYQVWKFSEIFEKELPFSKSHQQARPLQLIIDDLKNTILDIGNYSFFLHYRLKKYLEKK